MGRVGGGAGSCNKLFNVEVEVEVGSRVEGLMPDEHRPGKAARQDRIVATELSERLTGDRAHNGGLKG